jgi:hypothetical protein
VRTPALERSPVVGFALAATLAAAVSLAASLTGLANLVRWRPATAWCTGVVKRGSIAETERGQRFTMHSWWGCEGAPTVVVSHEGARPDSLCDGSFVAIEGWLDRDQFEAIRVVHGGHSKYDPCARWFCYAEEDKPESCRREAKFQ